MDQRHVVIPAGSVILHGTLWQPAERSGAVVLIAGPGGEVRDARLIDELGQINVASLQVDLLTEDEQQFDSRTGHFRYDADFLAHRLISVAQWLQRNVSSDLPLAFVGTTVGAAIALVAAALRPDLPSAVVAINGRTDLASDYLRNVKTPTLFVLNDMPVLRMNRDALAQVKAEKRIEVIHAEDGQALDHFVQKAVRWIEDRVVAAVA